MPSIPKPKKKRKSYRNDVIKKKSKIEPWVCPNCPRGNERKFPQKTIKNKKDILDHLWGDKVFIRDKGTCQKSGKKTNLSPHHIFGKKAYPGGRWLVDNGILLGYAEHIHWAHGQPYKFEEWRKERTTGTWWDNLHKRVQIPSQFRLCDFDQIKEMLEKEKTC